jgi:hypothetical protein
MKNPLAPIVLFAFNRPSHLIEVIRALKINKLSQYSSLYIFIDGPRNTEDVRKVNECVDIAKSIRGFKDVHINISTKNLGLSGSIISGLNYIFQSNNSAIILEDDLVVSRYFLEYMNDGLLTYKNTEDVCSIHGYMYPHSKKLPETFFLRGSDCWGWATWSQYWELFEPDGQLLLKKLIDSGEIDKFDYYGHAGNIMMLKNQINGVIDSWAIRWHASMFLSKKYTLYPNKSLIKNIGFDLSGTNSDNTRIFDTSFVDFPIIVQSQKVEENYEAIRTINKFFIKRNSKFIRIFMLFVNMWKSFKKNYD